MEMKKYNKARGNILYNKEWEFWSVVIIQIICVVAIPFAIHNIIAFIGEKSKKRTRARNKRLITMENKYEKAYHLFMECWNEFCDETQQYLDKELKQLGL